MKISGKELLCRKNNKPNIIKTVNDVMMGNNGSSSHDEQTKKKHLDETDPDKLSALKSMKLYHYGEVSDILDSLDGIDEEEDFGTHIAIIECLYCRDQAARQTINQSKRKLVLDEIIFTDDITSLMASFYEMKSKETSGGQNEDDGQEVVFKFGESVLTRRDVAILEGPYWLEDGTLKFFLEVIEKTVYGRRKDVVFLTPIEVQLIKMGENDDDEHKIANQVLQAHKVQKHTLVIVFPLNSSTEADTDSGTHWSVVMFYSPNGKFFHFDSSSSKGWNLNSANMLIERISPELDNIFSNHVTRKLYNVEVQPQDNAYDCGIHVLMNAELGVQHLLDHGNDETALKMEARPWDSEFTRRDLLAFVAEQIANESDQDEEESSEERKDFYNQ